MLPLPALLVLLVSSAVQAANLALVDVHVPDLRSGALLPDRVVEIEGQRILAVVQRSARKRREGQVVVSGEGGYLLPGLIDAHVHLATEPERSDNERATLSRLRTLLRGGVTSVRDMGGDVRVLSGLARRAELGLITAPDIHYSVIIGGAGFFSDPRTVSSAKGRKPGETDWMRAVTDETDFDALVLLRDNPLEHIEATRPPAQVIKRGEFVYRGPDPRLPFSDVHQGRRGIHLSGQIGNLPGTLTLAGEGVAVQTRQAMRNIGYLLEDHDLDFDDIASCTLMLADIDDWSAASEVYLEFFNPPLPARSAFAANGLALGARVEIECRVGS